MNMDDLKQSCHELSLPVTEKCNPISRDIDRVNGKQMVQILRRCDAEIFEKKNHDPLHQRLYSSPVIQTMVDVAKRVEMMLRDPEESLIVLSGCGTSGRIAFLLVTSFNEMLKAQKQKQICSYIIAGGDRALLTSQEAPEDDTALGARTLDKICAGKKHVLFIGISCGMSSVFRVTRRPESLIVLSGCGTSGRIAFLLVTSFNEMLKAQKQKQICSYIIAGGDRALLTSQEAPEDDTALGARTLDKICAGKKHVLFIGISCGMSAPFVAGQLDFCLKHLDVFTPVLLGFNPVHMARSEPMQDCSFHFKDIAEMMAAEQRHKKAFVLNPVLGAEAISGSSRMKGGSATKIILESILLAGHEATFRGKRMTPECISAWITASEMVHETTYSHSDELATLIHQAGESLQMNAHVYYIGWQTLGIIGLTDASECIPTYGADFDDIRGFINNGFREMKNKEGESYH
ncbi:glucokinase regulatory protein-like, partial [Sinocyclocheilus rhinocerous]|uniref:glucokinase regulatory protein-like n=1 Tax=Sinocyclocheilus rhinocerous TaxID=307959 RepID=UPI0007BAABD1